SGPGPRQSVAVWIGSTPTRDGRSSSIGAARILCSASSDSWPFGSRANSDRSSGAVAGAGAPGDLASDAIFAGAAQPTDPRIEQTKARAATRPQDRCNTQAPSWRRTATPDPMTTVPAPRAYVPGQAGSHFVERALGSGLPFLLTQGGVHGSYVGFIRR